MKVKLGKIHPYHWRNPTTKKTETGYQAEILLDGVFEDYYIDIAPEEIGGNWPEELYETETEERLIAMAKKMYEEMRDFVLRHEENADAAFEGLKVIENDKLKNIPLK